MEGICEELSLKLKLEETEDLIDEAHSNEIEIEVEVEEEEEDDDDDDGDFTFACNMEDTLIPADDVFADGQIRPFFPLFNRDLLFADYDSESSNEGLSRAPAVKKVFVETPNQSSSEAIEASPEMSKKSNSTGFSKLWRFKDYLNRSNSEGRDAFVFLNDSNVVREKSESSSKKNTDEVKVKVKKVVKGKKAALSAHEVYLKSKGVENDGGRRRSYLPYRPELVGFFTNVNGGLSRNVHPF